MILLFIQSKENNSLSKFYPWQFSSQACEGFFRTLRSLNTLLSTVVNCSVLDAIRKIRNIQTISDIINYNFEDEGEKFLFPRKNFLNPTYDKQNTYVEDLENFKGEVNFESIINDMTTVKIDASSLLHELGMESKNLNATTIMADILNTPCYVH